MRMVRPNTLTVEQTARLLHVPESFLPRLYERRLFPAPDADGCFDAGRVRVALRRLPWLRELGVPLCERELAGIDPRLRIPPYRGFTWSQRRHCRLWQCLAAAWAPAA